MDVFEPICAFVGRYIRLSEEERDYFTSLLRPKKVRRKQLIVQPDFVCREVSFVVSGALRSFLVDSSGKEHTMTLAVEDGWISDMNSYLFQEPATLFVEALEDATLIQLSYGNEQALLERLPKFERFFRITSQQSSAMFRKRILSGLSKTAEERYDEFSEKHPDLLLRIPQYILASYLGMTTQFLSKIRSQRAKKAN